MPLREILETAIFALAGAAVGSFLNLCIDRMPAGQSLLHPPSHCPTCGHKLAPAELVPILSYLWLRGRCRYCSNSIPRRLIFVELAAAALFAILWQRYGLTPQLALALFYACLFTVIFVTDLEHRLILNKVVYSSMVVALILSPLWPEVGLVNSLLGGALGFGFMLVPFLLSRGGMGAGDVKLAGLVGLVAGFPQVFIALFLAMVAGGLVAGFLLVTRLKGRKDAVPFGPFLAAGAMVTLLWGQPIYGWFLGG